MSKTKAKKLGVLERAKQRLTPGAERGKARIKRALETRKEGYPQKAEKDH